RHLQRWTPSASRQYLCGESPGLWQQAAGRRRPARSPDGWTSERGAIGPSLERVTTQDVLRQPGPTGLGAELDVRLSPGLDFDPIGRKLANQRSNRIHHGRWAHPDSDAGWQPLIA